MASGALKHTSLVFVGTGVDNEVINLGFIPTSVHIINMTSGDELWWNSSMADDAGYKRVAAGTGAAITANGITAGDFSNVRGIKLGLDTDINVVTEVLNIDAWE